MLAEVLVLVHRWPLILRAIHSLEAVVAASSSLDDSSCLVGDNDWALLRTSMVEGILQATGSSDVDIDGKGEEQYQALYSEVCLSPSAR